MTFGRALKAPGSFNKNKTSQQDSVLPSVTFTCKVFVQPQFSALGLRVHCNSVDQDANQGNSIVVVRSSACLDSIVPVLANYVAVRWIYCSNRRSVEHSVLQRNVTEC